MADPHDRKALYQRIATRLRVLVECHDQFGSRRDGQVDRAAGQRILREPAPDAQLPYSAFLVIARGPDRHAVIKGLRALQEADSTEHECPG